MNTLLWMGPVSASNLAGAVPAGWELRVYNKDAHGDHTSNAFRDWALTLGEDPLSKLAPGASQVVIAGFSAAHGATEVILQKVTAHGDTRLVGLLSCDSYYAANEDKPPKPGHLAWLQWLISWPMGRRALFTTSSTGGPNYLSASASFAKVANALDLAWDDDAAAAVAKMPPGAIARAKSPVVWLDYGSTYKHVQHATLLAPAGLRAWFGPGGAASSPVPPRSDGSAMLWLLGLAAFYAAYKYGAKR